MSTASLDMNTVPTAKVAYDALRQRNLVFDAPDFEGPLMPWEMLKARLPREPKVFIVCTHGTTGDEAPFLRLLADIVKQLPGQYVLLRAVRDEVDFVPPANISASKELADKIVETHDENEWARMFRESKPDAVITSQIFFKSLLPDTQVEARSRSLRTLTELRKELGVPV